MIFPPVTQLQCIPTPAIFVGVFGQFGMSKQMQLSLTQEGTGDPTVNVISNSYGAFTCGRLAPGVYEINVVGPSPGNCLVIGSVTDWGSKTAAVYGVDVGGNKILIFTYNITDPTNPVLSDDILHYNPLLLLGL